MSGSAPGALPHGAKGFHLGDDAVVLTARDKLIFTRRGAADHLTVHMGPATGVLDLHRKVVVDGQPDDYGRIYAISHDDLPKLLLELAPRLLEMLIHVARPLDVSTLDARRVGAVVGLLVPLDQMEAVTSVQRGKLKLDSEKLTSRVWIPELLEDLYRIPDGEFFTLFSTAKRNAPRLLGHGFADPRRKARRQLLWLPHRRLSGALDQIEPVFCEALQKYRPHAPFSPTR
jgi:hypothetical protein